MGLTWEGGQVRVQGAYSHGGAGQSSEEKNFNKQIKKNLTIHILPLTIVWKKNGFVGFHQWWFFRKTLNFTLASATTKYRHTTRFNLMHSAFFLFFSFFL